MARLRRSEQLVVPAVAHQPRAACQTLVRSGMFGGRAVQARPSLACMRVRAIERGKRWDRRAPGPPRNGGSPGLEPRCLPAEPPPHVHGTRINPLGHVFDDLDQFVEAVAVVASERDQFLRSLDNGAAFGCPCNRGPTAAPEFEESLIAERS